jgi:hypothetical protein
MDDTVKYMLPKEFKQTYLYAPTQRNRGVRNTLYVLKEICGMDKDGSHLHGSNM